MPGGIAFDMLAALYREEAAHRHQEGDEDWTEPAIVQSILANNLFGIDIDPRAIQIAAAALYLKARSRAKDVRIRQLNLVAPVFRLGKLPPTDPAIMSLRADLKAEAGIPEELTIKLLASLAGVDHLGSLLRVSTEVDAALKNAEVEIDVVAERLTGPSALALRCQAVLRVVHLEIPLWKLPVVCPTDRLTCSQDESVRFVRPVTN